MRKLVVVLVILSALFVAVDRIAVVVADHEIATRVATAYNLPSRPSVSVQGFPFLTQVASGNYRQITMSIGAVDSDGVQVDNLDARFTGVHAPMSELLGHGGSGTSGGSGGSAVSGITANQVAASGTVPFSAVRSRLPAGVRVAPDGSKLRLSGTVGYLGIDVPVSAVASLSVGGSGITVTPDAVTVGNGATVPTSVVADRLAFVIPVTGLPLHLTVTSVGVVPGGVRLSAAASDVHVTGTGGSPRQRAPRMALTTQVPKAVIVTRQGMRRGPAALH